MLSRSTLVASSIRCIVLGMSQQPRQVAMSQKPPRREAGGDGDNHTDSEDGNYATKGKGKGKGLGSFAAGHIAEERAWHHGAAASSQANLANWHCPAQRAGPVRCLVCGR